MTERDLCIGCKECMEACPFGAMQFDFDKGVAVKGDLCVERLALGEPLACSKACATRCIFYGNTTALSERLVASKKI